MTEEIYFQWQNEVLLKTIYPLREMKLRDFLLYCREIDLWAEYKDQKLEDLQADLNAYTAAWENSLAAAYQSYKSLYAYFTGEEMTQYMAKYKLTDETMLARVKTLHQTFLSYLPRYADVRKEKYFVTQQVSLWEQERKDLLQQVADKQRRVNLVVPEKQTIEKEQLQQLQTAFAIVDEELDHLYAFVSSYNKIEKRKLQLYQSRQAADLGSKGAIAKLDDIHTRLQPVEAKQKEIAAQLARLQTPPDLSSAQEYFYTEDISNQIRTQFVQADPSLVDALNGVHEQLASALRNTRDDAVKLITIKNHFYKLQEQQRAFQNEIATLEAQLRNMPANWPQRSERQARLDMLTGLGLKAIQSEIDRLTDYQAAFEYSKTPPAQLAQMIQAKQNELLQARQADSQLGKEASDLEAQLKSAQAVLNMSEEEYLVNYSSDEPITVKDIVRGKTEEYKSLLAQKDHLALLEEIVQNFIKQPERYPLWLQYMVIHFSGMRYASAHGSWADPKDLLMSLRTSDMEKEFKKVDDDAVEALAQQRISIYENPNGPVPGTPGLAQTQDQKWKDKIAFHLRGLQSPGAEYRRKALFDLRLDEENYDVEAMTPTQALEALEAIKDTLPEWMWKEIVELTNLRVKEVTDPNWEKLTPDEEEQRDEAQYAEFRAIMNKWKQDNLTGWREEHELTDQLIVTRSVCNEVAEQIQHLRGYVPPGGLTPKAPWYIKNEHDGTIPGSPRPYFVRPASANDYNVGASVLWLRFVNELPNPWRVAHPLQTKSGDGLIPAQYLARTSADDWVYTQNDVVMRTRTRINGNRQMVREQQWLRWIHEATVAAVAETVDGMTVLTFETALPYDDPRLSAVGVFKHDLYNLLFDGGEETYNGSFVGYLPEGAIPAGNLEEMLDWNHILLRQIMTPAELKDYQKKYVQRSA